MWYLTWKQQALSAVHNDLIQIAASKMHKGNIVAEFDEFIDPGSSAFCSLRLN
jgi:DNA polymerase III alpha subunit (gram-positive type)